MVFMDFEQFDQEQFFHHLWESVEIARPVKYSLFTFGDSVLPYYLVCHPMQARSKVQLTKGEVKITRPMLITPHNMQPEFENFFAEDDDGEEMVSFLLARSAAFSNLKFNNLIGTKRIVSDSVEEVVSRLNKELDREEEDRVAILTAPRNMAGVAVLKYATERVMSSAPDNLQELRERGFLP